jgi:hypothetical protein
MVAYSKKVMKPKKRTVKRRKQSGGGCSNYALLSDVFPKQIDVVNEVKNIVTDSLEGTKPMSELEAAKTVETVVETVQEVIPEIPSQKIENAVVETISEHNVQNGGKKLRKSKKKRTIKKKPATKKKTTTKRKTTRK